MRLTGPVTHLFPKRWSTTSPTQQDAVREPETDITRSPVEAMKATIRDQIMDVRTRMVRRRPPMFKLAASVSMLIATLVLPIGVASATSFATVTFAENATPSDSVVAGQYATGSVALTRFTSLSPSFSNVGYTFDHWNTLDSGGGTNYSDGQIYNFAFGDIVLYAQWRENSVTFYENSTGSDTTNFVEQGHSVGTLTLFSSLTPTFTKTGYTFAGWTTNANGTGTSYANGASYDFRLGSLSLYAQWNVIPSVSANFDAHGGSGSVSPVSGSIGVLVTLPSGGGMSYSGYTFAGWNTVPNGSGTQYAAGSLYTLSANVTLYAQWTANTVTFEENRNAFDPVVATQSSSVIAALTNFASLTPSFSNPGYTFAGWSTNENGSGTLYSDGASFDFLSGSATLYARWTAIPTYHVNFVGNGGTGLGGSLSGLSGTSVTLLGAGAFTNTGYSFSAWNTSPTGGGLAFVAGASLTLTSDVTLYAQWTPDVYTVTFAANGGAVTPASATYVVGTPGLALPTSTYPGYSFDGWYSATSGGTLAGGSGVSYVATSSVTLYAHWTAATYVVTFNPNGGTVSPTSASFTVGGSSVTLPTPSNGLSAFLGWFTLPSGGVLVGPTTYVPSATTTLYAQWRAPVRYTLSFDANGGSGSIAPVTADPGTSVTLPGVSGLARPGFTLVRWATTKNGAGTSYTSGSTMSLSASLTLYAQWNGHAPSVLLGAVGPFSGRATTLTAAMKAQVNRFAATIKSKKYKVVSLYGYAQNTGLVSLTTSISRARAGAVAQYLRSRFAALRVSVTIKSAGKGAVAGASAVANRRVEVFAQ